MPSHFTQIMRTNPQTGALERPWRRRDRLFVLADPSFGAQRHHKKNAITVSTYSEALELVLKGCPIRMSDGRSSASLVAPASLEFVDAPVGRIDDLWTYTMPTPPFALDEVMKDLRKQLLSQASDIERIANCDAASAFIGFPFESLDDAESDEAGDRIELECFNITRIGRAAYVSAFETWSGPSISEEDVDELEQIICGSITQYSRRHPSPLDADSSLYRCLMAAYYRWQIVDGCFLAGDNLDQHAITAIGILTGMPAPAIRNALSREGISTVKAKLDYPALIDWINTRRNFAPLREDEDPRSQWTWRNIHDFKFSPLTEAFASIRKRSGLESDELAEAEQAIEQRLASGELPSDADLRRYAKATDTLPDSFILAMRDHWAAK